jgi:histidinol-phosphate aminotransferase
VGRPRRLAYRVRRDAPTTAELCARARQPHSTNVAGEALAIATLQDAPLLDDRARIIAGERDRLAQELGRLGWLHPWPSEASFILLRVRHGDGLAVRDALRRHAVFARYLDAPRLHDHIRLTLATPEQSDRIIEAFRAVGEELGHAAPATAGRPVES